MAKVSAAASQLCWRWSCPQVWGWRPSGTGGGDPQELGLEILRNWGWGSSGTGAGDLQELREMELETALASFMGGIGWGQPKLDLQSASKCSILGGSYREIVSHH